VNAHAQIYGAPALYDLAFSYRSFARECGFLRGVYERRRGRPPRSFLELAAGPARHALEMCAAGVRATALDRSPKMAAYTATRAGERGLTLPYLLADMTAFQCEERFDLAASMLCSATYLLTDEAFGAHLERVHAALAAGGLYVLELPHPADETGAAARMTRSTWRARDAAGALDVGWLDQVTADARIFQARVRLEYHPFDGLGPVIVEDSSMQRRYSPADIEALLARNRQFEIDGVFGALDESVALDAPSAWRLVMVLAKR
jgi:hypothetical protein